MSTWGNCRLQLRLASDSTTDEAVTSTSGVKNQQISIFHDATELQARAIIWLASQQAEEGRKGAIACIPWQSQLYSPPGLSMKRSLQRFLQKRKTRIEATSPYKQLSN